MGIIVTGAAGTLGRSVVDALVGRGAEVAAIDRIAGPFDVQKVHSVICNDLANPDAAMSAVAEAVTRLGTVDALIHVAGAFEWCPVEQSNRSLWRSLYGSNVETAVAAIQACLGHMQDRASIVCVGAASAEPAGAGMAPYAAAKSAVARLVEALAIELAPRGIRVNAVLPAIIDTPRNRLDMPDADVGQWTSPAAVADAILLLIGEEARAINGALIPVTNNR